ncbi:hypothetical protein T265_02024 [Opisthorchis viverrini]|uniref:Uncharacterized protein n=1 Tax=Opisthorchis viverrini TaxID=6198 RepID=A0A075A0M4_OPIVI|nr:hypothetical protein T265_02024 [Opisthorchis viverrini]KER31792.1 hypothetical protein T265_02024 [Opisthorchis viverrini]
MTATERQEQDRPGKLGQKPRSCVSIRESVNPVIPCDLSAFGLPSPDRIPFELTPTALLTACSMHNSTTLKVDNVLALPK